MKKYDRGFSKCLMAFRTLIISVIFAANPVFAEESTANYALVIGGASNHNTGGNRNPFIEANSSLGLRIFSKGEFLKGNPYWEITHVFTNSTGGKAIALGGGIEWDIYTVSNKTFCGGLHAFHLAYENGKTGEWQHGPLISPYLCIRSGDWSINVEQLVPGVLFWTVSYYFN